MRKIIYSPAYGAGWVSWESDYELRKFMISYPPIVEYLESGQDFKEIQFNKLSYDYQDGGPSVEEMQKLSFPECLQKFVLDCKAKFGKIPYLSALRDAEIATAHGPVRITDYDGFESIEYGSNEWL